jgi:hypothetical protein
MVTPRSLYYKQLEDRLGIAAVENVTTREQRSGSIWPDLAVRCKYYSNITPSLALTYGRDGLKRLPVEGRFRIVL